jgi:hypothetical protein
MSAAKERPIREMSANDIDRLIREKHEEMKGLRESRRRDSDIGENGTASSTQRRREHIRGKRVLFLTGRVRERGK